MRPEITLSNETQRLVYAKMLLHNLSAEISEALEVLCGKEAREKMYVKFYNELSSPMDTYIDDLIRESITTKLSDNDYEISSKVSV